MNNPEDTQAETSSVNADQVLSTPGTFARDDDVWLQEVEQVVQLAGAHD